VRQTIRQAHALGLKVLLKPHIDLLRDNKPKGRFWRGDIGGCPEGMPPAPHPPAGVKRFTATEWDAWFASYAQFLAPYASLAQEEGVAMLSLNTELYCPNLQADRWRKLAADTRKTCGAFGPADPDASCDDPLAQVQGPAHSGGDRRPRGGGDLVRCR